MLHRMKRGWMWNQFFLLEEYTGTDSQYVGKLHSSQDRGDGSVKYILSGDGAGVLFIIDENTGDIHATKGLDREEKSYYLLRAQAVDKITGRPLEPESEFIIKIHDINDNEPTFTKEMYTANVPEMSDIGTFVLQVTATDADDPAYGNSAKIVYSILQGQPYFSVEPETGIIRTALPDMNRETKDQYLVVIQAKDMAGQLGGLSGTTTVNITLTDVNDNPPQFTQSMYQVSTLESAPIGFSLGRIKATDADIGENAEVTYNIIDGDGMEMFDIITDKDTQEGIIHVKKPLDFESKRLYSLKVEAMNTKLEPRFLHVAPFKDIATIRVTVEDVDEPPTFNKPYYTIEVDEDAKEGTIVGTITAQDPDASKNPVKYSLDRHTDLDWIFNVHSENGSIFTLKSLDRETSPWHNISIIATEIRHWDNSKQSNQIPVYIKVLDINDHAPEFVIFMETFVCDNAIPGQLIQTISAVDKDEPPGGHRFFFEMAPEATRNPNFTIRDNKDNTAGILTRRKGYYQSRVNTYLLPIIVSDNDYPVQSSTSTLTIQVCTCDSAGNLQSCNTEVMSLPAGLSTGALFAILFCIVIFLIILILFASSKRQRKEEPLTFSKDDVRDNIVTYNDEGGGEADTKAFDIGTLRNPKAIDNKLRRDIIPEAILSVQQTVPLWQSTDVRAFIIQRLHENDEDPTAPPYDSLATYAYEGNDSMVESLSSLESISKDESQDYDFLCDWGPQFKKLADMYGGVDSDRDS
ncbi:cadherin-9 isoform X2 [Latimeria chalumnae]|uniref:cadherin-9 isoform X2 n=1 Tax=Latimeria chalumnae TaxID=7897 RepID=UPI00313B5839